MSNSICPSDCPGQTELSVTSQGYETLDLVMQWAAIATAKDTFVRQYVWVKNTVELRNMSKGIQLMVTKIPQVLWEDLRAFFPLLQYNQEISYVTYILSDLKPLNRLLKSKYLTVHAIKIWENVLLTLHPLKSNVIDQYEQLTSVIF